MAHLEAPFTSLTCRHTVARAYQSAMGVRLNRQSRKLQELFCAFFVQ